MTPRAGSRCSPATRARSSSATASATWRTPCHGVSPWRSSRVFVARPRWTNSGRTPRRAAPRPAWPAPALRTTPSPGAPYGASPSSLSPCASKPTRAPSPQRSPPATSAAAAANGSTPRSGEMPWRPARLRTILAAAQTRTAASEGTGPQRHALARRHGQDRAESHRQRTRRRPPLARPDRHITGIIRFPIEKFGSDNAPERRAMRGQPITVRKGNMNDGAPTPQPQVNPENWDPAVALNRRPFIPGSSDHGASHTVGGLVVALNRVALHRGGQHEGQKPWLFNRRRPQPGGPSSRHPLLAWSQCPARRRRPQSAALHRGGSARGRGRVSTRVAALNRAAFHRGLDEGVLQRQRARSLPLNRVALHRGRLVLEVIDGTQGAYKGIATR